MPRQILTRIHWLERRQPGVPNYEFIEAEPEAFESDARSAHELLALVAVLAGMLEAGRTVGAARFEALDEAHQWLEASGLSLVPIPAGRAPHIASPSVLHPDRYAQFTTLPLPRFREEVLAGLWEFDSLVDVDVAIAMGCTHAVWMGGANCHAKFVVIGPSNWRDAWDRVCLARRADQIRTLPQSAARDLLLARADAAGCSNG